MATLPDNWAFQFFDYEVDDMTNLAKNPTSLEMNYGDDPLGFQGAYLSTIKTLELSSEVQYFLNFSSASNPRLLYNYCMWPAWNGGDWRTIGLDYHSGSPIPTNSGGITSWILLFPFILKLLKATLKASRLPCFRIISVMSAFISLSCFLGLYFTINKDFGYSMGDAFTLAGYVIAVGALICSFLFASHFRDCRCWKGIVVEGGGIESVEMGARALPGTIDECHQAVV